MTHSYLLAGTAALALTLGAQAGFAQTTLTGVRAVDDQIEDINRAAQIELNRSNDDYRYGNPDYREGLSGSASLGFSGKTGATDSSEFSMGARLRYAAGPLTQTIGMVIDYAEAASVKTKEDVFAVYEANYYFSESFYGFALGRVKSDGLASLGTDIKTDAFVGFGPGFRIVNTPDMAWRLQAGVGMSYLEDGLGNSNSETGVIASSRFYARLGDSMFLTNDTDVLKSDTALRVNNDLGLNFKMTDTFATRVSYLTEYNDSRATRNENKLGVSLVYSF